MSALQNWVTARCTLHCICAEDGCCEFSHFDEEWIRAVRYRKCWKSIKKIQKSLKYKDGTSACINTEW